MVALIHSFRALWMIHRFDNLKITLSISSNIACYNFYWNVSPRHVFEVDNFQKFPSRIHISIKSIYSLRYSLFMSKFNMYCGNKVSVYNIYVRFIICFFSIYYNIFMSPPIFSLFHAQQPFKMGILFLLDAPEMMVLLQFSKRMCQRYIFPIYIFNYVYVVAKKKNVKKGKR